MSARSLLSAVVVTTLALCNQARAQDDGEPEVTELEGTWEIVSFVVGGVQLEVEAVSWFVRFEGNSLAAVWTER